MTLEELKQKLRDSLADAKKRGLTIPRAWFEDELSPDCLKELGLKVVHTTTSPFSWIKHEKDEISLMEIEQFCHCHDILCLAVTSKDDALEIVTAYQFVEGDDGLIAREVNPIHLPTKGERKPLHAHHAHHAHIGAACFPVPEEKDFLEKLGAIMGRLGDVAED